MAYTSGYITGAQPAQNLVANTINTAMTSAGWNLVTQNFVANGIIWYVWQSNSSINQIKEPWYIACGWESTTAQNLQITLFESWNVGGTNLASGYPPNTSSIYPIANGWCNANPSALPNVVGSNIGWMAAGNTQTGVGANSIWNTTNNAYWMSTTIDRLIIAGSNTANINLGFAFYAGTYDSVWRNAPAQNTVVDCYPLCLVNLQIKSSAISSLPQPANSNNMPVLFTREIGQYQSSTWNFQGTVYNSMNWAFSQDITATETYSGLWQGSRKVIHGIAQGSGSAAGPKSMRGLLKDIYCFGNPSGLPSRGIDTVIFSLNGVSVTAINIGPSGGGNPTNPYYPFDGQATVYMAEV